MRPPLFKNADSSHKLAIGAQDLEDLQRSPINIHRNTFTYLPVDLDKEISSLVLLQPGSVSNAFAGRCYPNQIDHHLSPRKPTATATDGDTAMTQDCPTNMFMARPSYDADDDSPSPVLSPSPPLDNFSLSPEEDQPCSSRTNFFLSLRHRLRLPSRKHHRDIADDEGSDSSESSESSLDFDATLINAHRGITQYIEVDEGHGSINDATIARRADGADEPTATTRSHFFSRLFNGLLTTRKVKGDSHHKSSLRRIQKTLGFGAKQVSDESPPSGNGLATVASHNSGTSTERSASESPSYDIALPKRDLSPASTRSTSLLFSLFTKEPVRIRRDTRSEKLKFIRLMEQRSARRVRSASYAEQLSSISAEDSVSAEYQTSRNHSAQDNVFPTLIDTFYALVRPTDRDRDSMTGSGSTDSSSSSSSSNGSNRIPRETQEPMSYAISLPTPIETTLERRFFDIDMQMRIRRLSVANAKTDDISVLQENVHPPTQIDPINEMLGDFDHIFAEEPPQPLPTLEEKSLLELDLSSLEFESAKDCSGKTDSSFSSLAKSLRSLFRIRKRLLPKTANSNCTTARTFYSLTRPTAPATAASSAR